LKGGQWAGYSLKIALLVMDTSETRDGCVSRSVSGSVRWKSCVCVCVPARACVVVVSFVCGVCVMCASANACMFEMKIVGWRSLPYTVHLVMITRTIRDETHFAMYGRVAVDS